MIICCSKKQEQISQKTEEALWYPGPETSVVLAPLRSDSQSWSRVQGPKYFEEEERLLVKSKLLVKLSLIPYSIARRLEMTVSTGYS